MGKVQHPNFFVCDISHRGKLGFPVIEIRLRRHVTQNKLVLTALNFFHLAQGVCQPLGLALEWRIALDNAAIIGLDPSHRPHGSPEAYRPGRRACRGS